VKKVLITGANGFLGSHLVEGLSDSSRVIACIRAQGRDSRLASIKKSFTVESLDTCGIARVIDTHRPDVVIHGAVEYGLSSDNTAQYEANVRLPVECASALARTGTQALILIDTFYSKFPSYDHLKSYTQSKQECIRQVEGFSSQLALFNLRLEHMYGSRDGAQKSIPSIIRTLLANQPEIALTAGEQARDFVDVRDVVQAFSVILSLPVGSPHPLKVFEVGTGNAISWKHAVSLLHRLTRSNSRLSFGALPYRVGEPMESKADLSSLEQFGYAPKIDINKGFQDLIKSFRTIDL
jgi:CDP-paratose synthetase